MVTNLRCSACGQVFSPTGLAIHHGMKHHHMDPDGVIAAARAALATAKEAGG